MRDNNDRILVLVPQFMNYDVVLSRELEKKYDVVYVNSEKHIQDISEKIQKSIFLKGIVRFLKKLGKKALLYELLERKYYMQDCSEILKENYTKILCINGHAISNKLYKKLFYENQEADTILYLWDDVDNLVKKSHIKLFRRVYSYNLDDCEKYKFQYCPMFTQRKFIGHGFNDEFDIALIGTAHPDRLELARKIYDKYKNKYRFYIYFYHPSYRVDFFGHDKPLSYDEYIEILRKSKTVLDLPFHKQKGPTTRIFDAMLTETKVITVDKNIVKYPIYSSNICIIDRMLPEIPETIFKQKFKKNHDPILDVTKWVETILDI